MITKNKAQILIDKNFRSLTKENIKLLSFLLFMNDELIIQSSKYQVTMPKSVFGVDIDFDIEPTYRRLFLSDFNNNGFEVNNFEILLECFENVSNKHITIVGESSCSLVNIFSHTGYSIDEKYIIFEFTDSFLDKLV